MSSEVKDIEIAAGKYKKMALESRREFINLRLKQDKEIKNIYIQITKNITNALEKEGLSDFNKKRLNKILKQLKKEQVLLNDSLIYNFKRYLDKNVELATGYSKYVLLKALNKTTISRIKIPTIQKGFYDLNLRTIEAYWARTKNGILISDSIWQKSVKYRNNITEILQVAVAEGKDCVKTARILDDYVLKGKKTLVDDYPNMIKRIGNRIPKDISYEALRLARTEMTAAYGEGVLASAMINPASLGIKYILSAAHPKTDICDEICGADEYGLGIGVYPLENAPEYPFHPHCLCIVLTVNEQPEQLVERLKRWNSNPMSEPGLEDWYQNIYSAMN